MFCCCDWNIVCNIMALFRVIMAPHFIWNFYIHLYAPIYGFHSYFETWIQCKNVIVFINPYSFEFRMLPVSHLIWLANSFDVFYIESNGTQWTEYNFECFVKVILSKNVKKMIVFIWKWLSINMFSHHLGNHAFRGLKAEKHSVISTKEYPPIPILEIHFHSIKSDNVITLSESGWTSDQTYVNIISFIKQEVLLNFPNGFSLNL